MNKVRFAIEFTEKEPAADGCDVIRFLMSANAGEDLRPIAKIASGGELARIMLALKNVLAEQESIATLVFDEVDTGVSGRAAQKVAEKLTQVARHKPDHRRQSGNACAAGKCRRTAGSGGRLSKAAFCVSLSLYCLLVAKLHKEFVYFCCRPLVGYAG